MLYIFFITVIIIILLITIIARIKYYNIINLLDKPLNDNVRIAVCISGRIDNLEYCYNSWNKYFFENYKNIDIFMNVNECSESDKLFIQNTIKPKNITFEDPTITDKNYCSNMAKMFYRIYHCNQLKINYSNKNNIKYDYVVRLRPDLVFLKNLIIDNFNLDKLYIPLFKYDLFDMWNNFVGLNDQLFISNDRIANLIANFYNHIEKYHNLQCRYSELVLFKYVKENNIEIIRFKYVFFIKQYMYGNNLYKLLGKLKYFNLNCLLNVYLYN